MSDRHNICVAEEYVEALNAHDHERMRTYHGKSFRIQALGLTGPGDEVAYQAYTEHNWTAFPDLTFETAQMVAQGDYVVQNWTSTVTHGGTLITASGEEVLATGRRATTTGSSTMELRKGKIVLVDIYFNVPALLAEMKVVSGA